ncbi:cell division topological specificity factor MinE [Buchnera aphidicola (Kurisakia onigurumii)]|uniref:cell division topological specificity factor MinE n=1 Tax=Buchnera aphidicola TaxID=9 RepID=UPI0031B739C3
MSLINFFVSKKKNDTANIAKKRLKIIIEKKNKYYKKPNYFPNLKKEIIQVICKYTNINANMITIQYNKKEKDYFILELNIILPE